MLCVCKSKLLLTDLRLSDICSTFVRGKMTNLTMYDLSDLPGWNIPMTWHTCLAADQQPGNHGDNTTVVPSPHRDAVDHCPSYQMNTTWKQSRRSAERDSATPPVAKLFWEHAVRPYIKTPAQRPKIVWHIWVRSCVESRGFGNVSFWLTWSAIYSQINATLLPRELRALMLISPVTIDDTPA